MASKRNRSPSPSPVTKPTTATAATAASHKEEDKAATTTTPVPAVPTSAQATTWVQSALLAFQEPKPRKTQTTLAGWRALHVHDVHDVHNVHDKPQPPPVEVATTSAASAASATASSQSAPGGAVMQPWTHESDRLKWQPDLLLPHATPAPYGHGRETKFDETVRAAWEIPADRIRFQVDNPARIAAARLPEIPSPVSSLSAFCTQAQKQRRQARIDEVMRLRAEAEAQCAREPPFVLIDAKQAALEWDLSAAAGPLIPFGYRISWQPYKLHVYGPGGHFAAHRDTLHSRDHFVTAVVEFPTEHEGGELQVQQQAQQSKAKANADTDADTKTTTTTTEEQWTCLTSASTAAEVQIAVFYTDVLHRVTPVRSGHRVVMQFDGLLKPANPVPRVGVGSDDEDSGSSTDDFERCSTESNSEYEALRYRSRRNRATRFVRPPQHQTRANDADDSDDTDESDDSDHHSQTSVTAVATAADTADTTDTVDADDTVIATVTPVAHTADPAAVDSKSEIEGTTGTTNVEEHDSIEPPPAKKQRVDADANDVAVAVAAPVALAASALPREWDTPEERLAWAVDAWFAAHPKAQHLRMLLNHMYHTGSYQLAPGMLRGVDRQVYCALAPHHKLAYSCEEASNLFEYDASLTEASRSNMRSIMDALSQPFQPRPVAFTQLAKGTKRTAAQAYTGNEAEDGDLEYTVYYLTVSREPADFGPAGSFRVPDVID